MPLLAGAADQADRRVLPSLSAAPGEEVNFVSCDLAITEFRADLVMPRAGGLG